MAWWLEHAPCDMAMFWDRGADAFKKILVKAEPGPYDSLLMHAADRLAAQSDGEVVVLKMVGTQATPEEMQSHRDYHYQLRRLAQTDVKSLIVRTDDQKASLGEITQKFDLLLLGAPPEQAFRNLFLGSREQRIAEAAQCSVLSLKTPRHRVHARLELPTGTGDERFELAPFISLGVVPLSIVEREKFGLLSRALPPPLPRFCCFGEDKSHSNFVQKLTPTYFDSSRHRFTCLKK